MFKKHKSQRLVKKETSGSHIMDYYTIIKFNNWQKSLKIVQYFDFLFKINWLSFTLYFADVRGFLAGPYHILYPSPRHIKTAVVPWLPKYVLVHCKIVGPVNKAYWEHSSPIPRLLWPKKDWIVLKSVGFYKGLQWIPPTISSP